MYSKYAFFILILLCLCQQILPQQYNAKPGYIVTLDNDTVYGVIKERNNYTDGLEFISGDNKKFSKYSPGDLNSFMIDGKKLYRPVDVQADSLRNQSLFMLTLVEGLISLYYCETGFFVATKNGVNHKIEKRPDIAKRIEEGPRESVRTVLLEDKRYIGTFKILTQDCGKIFSKTDKLQYDLKSFTRLISEYNLIMNPDQPSVVTDRAMKARLQTGLKLTYLINDMDNFPGDGRYTEDNFESRSCFSAGIAGNISFNQKFSVQPEILLTQRRGYLYKENGIGILPEVINFKLTYLETPVILYYTLPTNMVSPSFFAGPIIGWKVIDNSDIQTIYTTKNGMETLEYGFRIGAGITLKGRFSGEPFLRFEYYYEKTLTNVYDTHMRYHQLANNFSATVLFN